MRVVAREVDESDMPQALIRREPPGQRFLTVGREYTVHALTVFEGHVKFQIVDDLGHPALHAAWLFDVVDPSIPNDWIASPFRAEPSLVVGPPFLASDLDAYARMVQLEMAEVDEFWKRLDRPEAGRHDGDG